MAAADPQRWSQQAHIDLGALSQRVTGLEGSIADMASSIRDISKKFDARPTNWWQIILGVVGVLGLIGGFFAQAISPIYASLERHERALAQTVSRQDYERDEAQTDRWLSSVRDRLRSDEDKAITRDLLDEIGKRQDERLKSVEATARESLERLDGRIGAVDAQLIKRPEVQEIIDGVNDRITALSARMNEGAGARK